MQALPAREKPPFIAGAMPNYHTTRLETESGEPETGKMARTMVNCQCQIHRRVHYTPEGRHRVDYERESFALADQTAC